MDTASKQINILEPRAAFFAQKSFCKQAPEGHIQLQIDNTTAVSYISNIGLKIIRAKLPRSRKLGLVHPAEVVVLAIYIEDKLNVDADNQSRHFQDKHK